MPVPFGNRMPRPGRQIRTTERLEARLVARGMSSFGLTLELSGGEAVRLERDVRRNPHVAHLVTHRKVMSTLGKLPNKYGGFD